MPIITLDGGHLNKEQKAELVKEYTEISAKVTGIPQQAFVVIIRENEYENIGVGGELLADKMK